MPLELRLNRFTSAVGCRAMTLRTGEKRGFRSLELDDPVLPSTVVLGRRMVPSKEGVAIIACLWACLWLRSGSATDTGGLRVDRRCQRLRHGTQQLVADLEPWLWKGSGDFLDVLELADVEKMFFGFQLPGQQDTYVHPGELTGS